MTGFTAIAFHPHTGRVSPPNRPCKLFSSGACKHRHTVEARAAIHVPRSGELDSDTGGGQLHEHPFERRLEAGVQPEGFVRSQLSLSRLEGGQLRDGQSGPGFTGRPCQRGVASRGVRDQSGTVRDQVQPARARQPRGEREHTAARAGHDQGDRRPVEHRGAGRRVR